MKKKDDFVFQVENPTQFINETFSSKDQLYLNSAIKQGYRLTQELIESTEWLQVLRGDALTPRLKSIASEFMIVQYIERGLLSLNYRIDKNAEKNHKHILLYDNNNKVNITLNQVDRKGRPSSYAKYKVRKYSKFESYFDFEIGELITEQPIYLELNHGYQSETPNFVILGIPKSSSSWYGSVVLSDGLLLQNSIENKFKTVEQPLEDFSMKDFTEFIIRNELK